LPIGLGLIFLVLGITAIVNFFTKEVATVGGMVFTGVFMTVFTASERYHEGRRRGAKHQHLEQFNQQAAEQINAACLGLSKPYRKLVAIRSTQNLFMLEKALEETDPETTDVVVMTAKVEPGEGSPADQTQLDSYDQQLMTAVVERAEKAGKQVKPLIVPTNNPLYAVIRTAKELGAQELVVGASNKYTADMQLEQIALYWINVNEGKPVPLTVRILGRDRDVYFDLNGGNRIPKISERAKSVAELRAAGVGVDRVLLAHDGSPAASDLFQAVVTMLDPQVRLALVPVPQPGEPLGDGNGTLAKDVERAEQLGRELKLYPPPATEAGPEIVRLARAGEYDLVILGVSPETAGSGQVADGTINYVLRHAHCRVFLAAPPAIPEEPEEQPI
ncbi:MAG TPA: universal stress protein, partial [Gemmataceae bacterium]|nr:universal stress protein [Gemmataceae bacterium]